MSMNHNMCYIENVYINTMNLILVYESLNEQQKIVFLFHGLLENKFNMLPFAYKLAKQGFFVVLLDTRGHGERENSFDNLGYYDFNLIYRHAYETANDVNSVINYLKIKYPKFDYLNIICSGISNGANIALIAGYLVKNVTHVLSVIGSLNWGSPTVKNCSKSFRYFAKPSAINADEVKSDIENYNPINQYINLNTLPFVLFQNGILDMTMPISSVENSFNKLKNIYKDKDQEHKISLIKYSKNGHSVSNKMIIDLLKWLREKTKF